jgi:hypothetical protein
VNAYNSLAEDEDDICNVLDAADEALSGWEPYKP